MSRTTIRDVRVAGVATCVPRRSVDNLSAELGFDAESTRKVVAMAGVRHRRVVTDETATDLCFEAAANLLERLGWERESITGLILVTQSPDHFLPSSSCLVHRWLGLPDTCATFDIGLGCSGYPYGLYVASTMLAAGGHQRILMLHGETPSRFVSPDDRATVLLFGDAGSATALESAPGRTSHFVLHTDGSGHDGLIIRGGAFRDRHPADPRHLALEMDGAGIFNFTIKRVPRLIADTLAHAGLDAQQVDAYVFHQANRFIIKHLAKKAGLSEERVPFTLEDTANCGGPSVPVTLTRALGGRRSDPAKVMLLGFGVGLSWGSALLDLDADVPLLHADYQGTRERC